MYAVVETGGKQYKVSAGDTINVEKLDAEAGAEFTLDKVLAIINDGNTVIGTPYVASASVSAEVVESGKKNKVIVFKQKTRKGYRRLRGHRQPFTTLKIKEIQGVRDGS